MKIGVRFAGFYRTLVDEASLELELEEGTTVELALMAINDHLGGRLDPVVKAIRAGEGQPQLLFLVDSAIAERSTILKDGNLLALVPPMAGGQ